MRSGRTICGPPLEPRVRELSGETLPGLLDRAVARSPDAIALVIRRDLRDERWSYRQLAAVVERVADRLRAAGVHAGDRVLTWSQNDPWLVAAYFAVWRVGAVIVPLDLRMQTDVAIRIGRLARASVLLAGVDVDRALAAELDVPILGMDEVSLDPKASRDRPPSAGQLVASGDLAEIIFTSGTTSDPKGVMLTHGQIVHSARAIAQTAMGSRPDRGLAVAPLSHMYGQTVPLLMGFMGGSTLVFLNTLSPKALVATMRRERITAITLTPHLMKILLQGLEAEARRSGREANLARARVVARWLPHRLRRILFRSVLAPLGGALDVISSGGALLSVELQQAFEDFGVRVIQGYGRPLPGASAGRHGRPTAGGDRSAHRRRRRVARARSERHAGLLGSAAGDVGGARCRRLVPHRRCCSDRRARRSRHPRSHARPHLAAQWPERVPGGRRGRAPRDWCRASRGRARALAGEAGGRVGSSGWTDDR
jgi:long-subunit acyl-CoA synthetase (AMP-forming)